MDTHIPTSYPKKAHTAGSVFGAPLTARGFTALPWTWLAGWLVLSWQAGARRPERSLPQRLLAGAAALPATLGVEWGHNLAHLAAAWLVGKPADEVRLLFGMPRLVYNDLNDRGVTPRQHIWRALGGPLFNALMLPILWLARGRMQAGGLAHDTTGLALRTNAFIGSMGLLPIVGLDGAAILKWGLVEAGRTTNQADEVVRKANLGLSGGLALVSAGSFRHRHKLMGALFASLAGVSLAIGLGWIKEENAPF